MPCLFVPKTTGPVLIGNLAHDLFIANYRPVIIMHAGNNLVVNPNTAKSNLGLKKFHSLITRFCANPMPTGGIPLLLRPPVRIYHKNIILDFFHLFPPHIATHNPVTFVCVFGVYAAASMRDLGLLFPLDL